MSTLESVSTGGLDDVLSSSSGGEGDCFLKKRDTRWWARCCAVCSVVRRKEDMFEHLNSLEESAV